MRTGTGIAGTGTGIAGTADTSRADTGTAGTGTAGTTYQLALCELFDPRYHGLDENSSPAIDQHFLIYMEIEPNVFQANSYKADERRLQRFWRNNGSALNYNKKQIRLEIICADLLTPGGEEVAYLKTFWLRIVQRCWKKVFKARQEVIKKRSTMRALQIKQRTGQWPEGLRHYPVFKLNLFS